MATTRTLPTPPPASSHSLASPNKKDLALKPNPHPYAIRTTSSGLLTRSNSSGYNAKAIRHYYVPPPPNPIRSDSSKGHRPTKSLNSMSESPTRESPRPLPKPPALDIPSVIQNGSSHGGYVSADEMSAQPRRRPRRSETMPIISLPTAGLLAPPPSIEQLPENPKLWTPSQLAIYLTSALRVTSGNKPGEIESIGLPPLVAKDIASFVRSARIGGRTFLRMNEEDLEALGMNKKWRQALLAALRNLRQDVLKGRIWGADGSPTSSPSVESGSADQIFLNTLFNSSSSSIDSSSSISTGGDDHPDGPGAVLGRSKARRYRNGRVRGMIESFERSGSFSSEGGVEDGDTGLALDRANLRRWARQEGQVTGQIVMVDESPSPTRRRPLPIPPVFTGASSGPLGDEEEPTMEALLATLAKEQPATGARAWEEMDLEPGVTVKRVPSNESEADLSVDRTLVSSKSISSLGSGRGSDGSSKGKPDRRVVTAIFTPIPGDPSAAASEQPAVEAASSNHASEDVAAFDAPPPSISVAQEHAQSRPLPPLPDLPDVTATLDAEEIPVPAPDPEREGPSRLERLLEAEILATRALLDTFRARLEAIEQKVAELEAKDAQCSTQTQTFPLPRDADVSSSVPTSVEPGSVLAVPDALLQHHDAAVPPHVLALVSPSDPAPGSGGLAGGDAGVGPSSSTQTQPSSSDPKPSALEGVIPGVVRRLQQSSAGLFSSPSSSAAPGSSAVARRKAGAGSGEDGEGEQPATVGDLPSYVFLVGLGVCAVVLQVVLRKVVGRGAVGGFKP
ncbi:hypothetical protein BD413DRAFT_211684 [Trametes elegans]|nr:hypothetical protein BD413DRAFT_211684 [Trametes elegans]